MARRISSEQLLQAPVRRRIYERVDEIPGTHLRQLQRDLEISLGSLEYHLHRLVKADLLVTRGDSHLKAYFVRNGFDRRDCDYLHALRQRMQRRIALEILHRPGIRFQALVARLPIGPSSTSFHTTRMVRSGLLEDVPDGRTKRYYVADPNRVRRLIVRYRDTFMDDVVDRFADAWMDLGPPERRPAPEGTESRTGPRAPAPAAYPSPSSASASSSPASEGPSAPSPTVWRNVIS